ncbi:MAG: hypothetical protein QOG53_3095 [Frankiales bacterium]|jgi:CHAT domain-containing protein/tetratricopeptide (TPR) repeat protein|nr:hypothetical protein [Frankiales bacterium]
MVTSPGSLSRTLLVSCARCGRLTEHVAWLLVNATAEPTPLDHYQYATCTLCGEAHPHSQRVVVLDWCQFAPWIILRDEDEAPATQDRAWLVAAAEVLIEAKDRQISPFARVLPLTWKEVSGVTSSALEEAMEAAAESGRPVTDPQLSYLTQAVGWWFVRTLAHEALDRLTECFTFDDLRQELHSTQFDWHNPEMLEEAIAALDDRYEGAEVVREAVRGLLTAVATGGSDELERAHGNLMRTVGSVANALLQTGRLNSTEAPEVDDVEQLEVRLRHAQFNDDPAHIAFYSRLLSTALLERRPRTRTEVERILEVLSQGEHAAERTAATAETAEAAASGRDIRLSMMSDRAGLLATGNLRDPEVRLQEADELFRVLDVAFTEPQDGDQAALVRTNHGICLTRLQAYRQGTALVEEAMTKLDLALSHRLERGDPIDLAYTYVNRGTARRMLWERTQDLQWLTAATEDLTSALDLVNRAERDPALSAQTAKDLADLLKATADSAPEVHEAVGDDQPSADDNRKRALDLVLFAVRTRPGGANVHDYLLWADLAWDVDELRPQAASLYDEAVKAADEIDDPQLFRRAAFAAGLSYADNGTWDEASLRFQRAADAHEALLVQDPARESPNPTSAEATYQNVYRWAAYCAARSGDAASAVELVENGRCRRLGNTARQQAAELAALRSHRADLADEYVATRSRLQSAADEGDVSQARMALHECVGRIREAGFARFLLRTPMRTLCARATPIEPFVFLITAIWGSVALVVVGPEPADAEIVTSDLTSAVVAQLTTGMYPDHPEWLGQGLLLATDADDVMKLLDRALPILSLLMQPVAVALHRGGASRVALVTAGNLAMFPLHAAPVEVGQGETTLLDLMPVRFLPSAVFDALSEPPAQERTLVALADPQTGGPPLRGARAEVISAVEAYEGNAHAVFGPAATRAFLFRNLDVPCDLHIACHASWSVETGAVLQLSDGSVSVTDLEHAADGRPQIGLVLAAACTSGRAELVNQEEARGLAAAFLNLGASGVITALWPIDDAATATVVQQFYANLPAYAGHPTEALRAAVFWLRGMDAAQLRAFLRNTELRTPERDLTQVRGLISTLERWTRPQKPFAHPYYWAALLYHGR